MFEDYLQDSYHFYTTANAFKTKGQTKEARRYYRASVFCLASSIEAFINYLALGFEDANILTEQEVRFLQDLEEIFDPGTGQIRVKEKYYSAKDKLRFLIRRFVKDPELFLTTSSWHYYIALKDLRDNVVHPKDIDDEIDLLEYETQLKRGLTGSITMIDSLLLGIYHKGLRQNIRDLIP